MGIDIAKVTEADLPRLEGALASLGYAKDNGYFAKCFAEQEAGRRQMYIATLDGAVAGWGMLNWQPQYQLYRRLDIPEIQDLNVLPAMRRNGVASAMIGFAEKLARENGRTQIGISFGLYPNYGPAQRLYIRLGYIPDGYGVTYDRVTVRPGESRPVDDSLCLMLVKDLADG
jgi:GNAT superfamily N-acetyltransferase